jgi:hypothetical protein
VGKKFILLLACSILNVYKGVYDDVTSAETYVLAVTHVSAREAMTTTINAIDNHLLLISLALTFIFSPPSSF